MSDLVGNPEDRFSNDEAQIAKSEDPQIKLVQSDLDLHCLPKACLSQSLGSIMMQVLCKGFTYHQQLRSYRDGISSERLEKPGIKPTTPGLQAKMFCHYTTKASSVYKIRERKGYNALLLT